MPVGSTNLRTNRNEAGPSHDFAWHERELAPRAIRNGGFELTAAAIAAGVSCVTYFGDSGGFRTRFFFEDVVITMTDATTAGCHGTLKLGDFPKGFIQAGIGAWNLTSLLGAAFGASAVLDIGLGSATVGVDNDVLATTEQDLLTKLEPTLSSSAATNVRAASTTLTAALDGNTTRVACHFNVAATAATADANGTLTVNGWADLIWRKLGGVDFDADDMTNVT